MLFTPICFVSFLPGPTSHLCCSIFPSCSTAPLQPHAGRYAFDMPKLPPTTIDAETLKLLREAKTVLKTSQAEVLRQCIRAEAPLMIARQRAQATFDAGLTALQSLKFDKKLVKLAKEARRGDR